MPATLLLAALITPAAPPGFNYDESKVPEYTLPPVLGDIATANGWPARRTEIVRLFEQHVYGVTPAASESMTFQVEAAGADDGIRHSVITAKGTLPDDPDFEFTFRLTEPVEVTKPAPVVVVIVHPSRWKKLSFEGE
ncbi:MAG: hypothetical protein AAF907_05765, partial [Planctomycetota bacterium]